MGVIFRPVANYGMPDWLRVTVGTEVQNRIAIKAFGVLKKSKKSQGSC
jgi:histidinol-phosphate aminotransferase